MTVPATASQTVGPFFRIGLEPLYANDLAPGATDKLTISGRVLDGDGKPVEDAILEIWQADAQGRHRQDATTGSFTGFGRVPTNANGEFRFSTIKPGRVPGPHGKLQASHLVVAVFMRGLLIHLLTRVYFPGEAANAEDAVLQSVPADRRSTLIARASGDGLQWDVILQGENETVFFDY